MRDHVMSVRVPLYLWFLRILGQTTEGTHLKLGGFIHYGTYRSGPRPTKDKSHAPSAQSGGPFAMKHCYVAVFEK